MIVVSVRAKFIVDFKESGDSGRVSLIPVYSTDPRHENKAFWDATPGGQINLWIQNNAAFSQFTQGQSFYVDFTPAPRDEDIAHCPECGQSHHALCARDGIYTCPSTGKPIDKGEE